MSDWQDLFAAEKQKSYFSDIVDAVAKERQQGQVIYPAEQHVFSAFDSTPFNQVKVVILGQDPYHGPNQAHGLSFSVLPGVKIPPSLRNMYKELAQDVDGFVVPEHGYLQSWADQGVLLLNAVLTVREGQANSHQKLGWETFTDAAIDKLNRDGEGIVFLLWGSHAQKKAKNIDKDKHHVLTAPHPSPLSAHRGFFGCGHFSKTNQYLTETGKQAINWNLPTSV